ncbi:MAG: hypothetical protein KME60_28550 [Cyanomargarita calcarea GSE-NOS-MK-12-04C]|jgi:hypothetical protein|uniref:PhoD-like phosphatase metallophosphatase domain-containing protein n=1 Tax=Cyanomargarita calcarea GSE-NOS-MK-12-04C TaxID=2839659 RepID=A0A951UV26_9CYAN|nr:hypothetical protein [Cyanomargarita calcarea GSE-NOS-MK-12-04C]
MTWTHSAIRDLSVRIDNLPLVLAGPILRCTQSNSVTVWLALKECRSVTLVIFDTNKKALITGTQKTTQLGTNLHIVCVTAKSNRAALLSGENYLYNLAFNSGETLSTPGILNQEGSTAGIVYPPYDLPSFALPPTNLNDLRIIHGSCRKPHGQSLDALVTVDKMIREALIQDPKKRPHQLFLTGDQIYADDVADALLLMLMDASKTLLGWSEILPDVESIIELQPGKRNNLATYTAGLTASINKINKINNIAKSHLFTFGEYISMYLFAWSDVLWVKPEDFPTYEDINPNASKILFQQEVIYLKEFQTTLKDVRRALANVPTYMILDDHDITDDWYLNMAWCDRTLKEPLGRRIIQNGLLAYAICQAWGNTPEQFEAGKPGDALLKAASLWSASGGTNQEYEQEITLRVGLPSLADIRNSHPRGLLSHSENALRWHYTVTNPSYEVIVLDTRTWREFPGEDCDCPALLGEFGCYEQISKVRHPDTAEITLVISPSPFIGVPFLEGIQKTVKNFSEKLGTSPWGFDPEAWGLQKTAFERLLATLAFRSLPKKENRVIILSGDVHYSFASRLQYSANLNLQNSENTNIELIVTQFTSSSLRNEVKEIGGSLSLHKKGFSPFNISSNLPKSEVLGWGNQGGNELKIGILYAYVNGSVQSLPLRLKGSPAMIDLVQERSWFQALEITKKPEWWYRIDFLAAKAEEIKQPKPSDEIKSVIAPLPGQERHQALEEYLKMAKNYHDYQGKKEKCKEIVGLNNIGEITFELVDGKQVAVQTLWWRLESRNGKLLEPFPLTRTEVSLLFNDEEHSMQDILKEVD